jgi:hypothetical protein
MSYEGYRRWVQNLGELPLTELVTEHLRNMEAATNERGYQAWSRMYVISTTELRKRIDATAKVIVTTVVGE